MKWYRFNVKDTYLALNFATYSCKNNATINFFFNPTYSTRTAYHFRILINNNSEKGHLVVSQTFDLNFLSFHRLFLTWNFPLFSNPQSKIGVLM